MRPKRLLSQLEKSGVEGVEQLIGFDTFWYSWIAVNAGSKLLF